MSTNDGGATKESVKGGGEVWQEVHQQSHIPIRTYIHTYVNIAHAAVI